MRPSRWPAIYRVESWVSARAPPRVKGSIVNVAGRGSIEGARSAMFVLWQPGVSQSDPVPIHDVQATVLNCLGIDHTRLTFKFQGRHFRLTDVAGNVVKPMLA